MNKILGQLWKELVQLSRDRLTLALGFLLPVATLLIFGFAIKMESKNIPLAVQDFSATPESRRLVECLVGTNQLRIVSWKGHDVMQALDSGKAKAAIVIPPDFARKITSGQPAEIQAIINGIDINNARVIKNSILATTGYFSQSFRLTARQPIVTPHLRLIFNPGRYEPLFIVPGIYAVVLAIYPAFLAAIAMVKEIEQGTLVQVYASSLEAHEFILGKLGAYFLVGIGQALVLMTIGFLCFNVSPVGNLQPLLVCTVIYLTISVLIGLLIGSGARGQLDAIQAVATLQFMTSMLLSGFLYPKSGIPFPISVLSYLVPAGYYIEVTRNAFVRGTGWDGLIGTPFVLAGAVAVVFTILWMKIRPMRLREPAR